MILSDRQHLVIRCLILEDRLARTEQAYAVAVQAARHAAKLYRDEKRRGKALPRVKKGDAR